MEREQIYIGDNKRGQSLVLGKHKMAELHNEQNIHSISRQLLKTWRIGMSYVLDLPSSS